LDSCLNDLGGSSACRAIALGANDGKAIAVRLRRHHPQKRMIQYSATPEFSPSAG